jgi:hypothetical protein
MGGLSNVSVGFLDYECFASLICSTNQTCNQHFCLQMLKCLHHILHYKQWRNQSLADSPLQCPCLSCAASLSWTQVKKSPLSSSLWCFLFHELKRTPKGWCGNNWTHCIRAAVGNSKSWVSKGLTCQPYKCSILVFTDSVSVVFDQASYL